MMSCSKQFFNTTIFLYVIFLTAQCQISDVNITISGIGSAKTDQSIVCGFPSPIFLNITVDNVGSVSFPHVTKLNSNFDFTVQITDSAILKDSNYLSDASVQGYESATNQLGIGALTSVVVQVQTQVHLDPTNCTLYSYICTNVTAGQGASFVENDDSDNSFCADIKSTIEITQPRVDVEVMSMTYTDPLPIVRNTVRLYSVTVSAAIAKKNEKYSILQNLGHNRNFKASFFMADKIPPAECRETNAGLEYKGQRAFVGDKACDPWKLYNHSADSFPDVDQAENYCRNPDQSDTGPWCYVNNVKTVCHVPQCLASKTCRHYKSGSEYRGVQNHTISGYTCQRWDSLPNPYHPQYYNQTNEENYCRNPDQRESGPWCYTSDLDTTTELCGIPFCFPDGDFYLDHMPIEEGTITTDEAQKGLDLTDPITLTVGLPVYIDHLVCGVHNTLCVILSSEVNATYVESNSDNNMICQNIGQHINCKPEINIEPQSVKFQEPPIRGYNTTVSMDIEIRNRDKHIAVLDINGKQNFKLQVFFTSYDVKSVGSTSRNIKIEREVNISNHVGLQPNSSATLTGQTTVLLDRDLCPFISYICVAILPGPETNYRIYPGAGHIQCFTSDDLHKNCLGTEIHGIQFCGTEAFGRSSFPTTLKVHWKEGTDVKFQVNFGHDTALFYWTWEMHRNESVLQETTVLVNHTYAKMGVYTAQLKIENEVTVESYSTTINVQPNLEDYITLETITKPKEAPAEVMFAVKNIKEDSVMPIEIMCTIDWGDNSSEYLEINMTGTFVVNHTYTDKFTNTRATFICVNNVSFVVLQSEDIILREPIRGLIIVSQEVAFPVFRLAHFNVTMETGSHVNLFVTFGDGSSNNYTNNNRISSSFVWVISHMYANSGIFTVYVRAVNERFQSDTALQAPLIIQNPISNITILGNDIIKYPTGQSLFEIQEISPIAIPTNVSCRWTVNDIIYGDLYTENFSTNTTLIHGFTYSDIGASNEMCVVCYNLVSQQTACQHVDVVEVVHRIITAPVVFAVPNHTFEVLALASNGSHVNFLFDFGKNITNVIPCAHVFANTQMVTANHRFSTVGNYSVKIMGYNVISTAVTELTVSVMNEIVNLSLCANESVIYPPATVDHIVKKGLGQQDLSHLHCYWIFSRNHTAFTYIPTLNDQNHFHFVSNHTESSNGPSLVTVNCTNQVSWLIVQTSVEIVLDVVTISSLKSMPPVWYTNVSSVMLEIKTVGKDFCFVLDMGDGTSKYIHGSDWCRQEATVRNLELKLISTETTEITQNHTYKTWGNFTVQVLAFNHVSTDNASTVTVVKDWYCNKPHISFARNFTNASLVTQFRRGSEFHIRPDKLKIDCMKSLNKTMSILSVSKLLDDNEDPIVSFYNVTELHYFRRMLDIGQYAVTVYMAMLGLNDFHDTAVFYFEIIPTPLVVHIQGEETIWMNFNEKVLINALDSSFDPDLEPSQDQGIVFTWYCKQIEEEFLVDGSGEISAAGEPDLNGLDSEAFRGCFGGGPGKIPVTGGKFDLDTGMMVPNKTFVITVEATKDIRQGTSEKVIIVHTPAAPVINIQCRENCYYRKRLSGSLIMDINCTENCHTKYGGIKYMWSLEWSDNATGNVTQYTDLEAITYSGIDQKTLYTHPWAVEAGRWHTATVVTWTPFSYRAKATFAFLTNVPPHDGNCTVHPKSGFAMMTVFNVKCDHWKEWLSDHSAGLKYEYRVRALGAERSYLLYYGSSPSKEQMFLPMGNYKLDFLNEVVIYIVDSVGDYFELTTNVTVRPEAIPKSEIVLKILFQLENDTSDLNLLIKEQRYQASSDRVYSMLSLLNLPRTFATTNESEDMDYLLELKKITRTALTELVATFPVKSMEGLDQTNEIIRGAFDDASEVSLDTQGTGVTKIGDMANFFVSERSLSTPEKKKRLATDLTVSTIKVRIASNYYLEDSLRAGQNHTPKLAPGGEETTTLTYELTSESSLNGTYNDTTKAKVAEVMKKSIHVVNTLTGALLDDKQEGDPDDIISFKELTLMLGKEEASKLSNAEYSSEHGGVVMPDVSQEEWAHSCVERKVAFSSINTYIWDDSAEEVTSGVIDFEISSCSNADQSKRRKRSLPSGISFDVDLPVRDIEEPKLVTEALANEEDMVFHHLDLSQTTKSAVTVAVYPVQNETLDVYIQFNEFPTVDTFYKMMQVPKNQSFSIDEDYEVVHTEFIPLQDIADNDVDYIYLGVKKAGCVEGTICQQIDTFNITYSYKLAVSKCQIWDPIVEMWTSKGCEVQPGSTAKRVKFKSNLFGSMGAGLFVGPNTIDFSSVFDNISQKFADSAAVVGTVAVFMVLYIPLVIICRRLDSKDRKKWMVIPLIDNVREDQHTYELHVYTGLKSNSGTTSKVDFILAGTEGDTGIRLLEDGQRRNFQTGDVNSFLLTTEVHLGIPCTLKIWHDNTGNGKTKDWYLSKIVVVDLQRQKWYLFLCDQWLSADKEDGRTERVLHISSLEDLLSSGFLLQNNIKKKLFDDHLWLSIGCRKTRSTFTRVQRLSCCWAILFLTMVSNAMWYGTGDSSNSNQTAFEIGPITLTTQQLYTSIMSSLVVVPPVLLISTLFAKSGGRTKKKKKNIVTDISSATRIGKPTPKPTGKRQTRLPFWFVLIAYTLVLCSVVCGAFFTVLYAFQWGKEKSEEWLGTFMLSFVQSVLLIQPAKVVVVAILLSFLFKKDADTMDYEDAIGKMENIQESLKPANLDVLKQSQELSKDELEQIKRRQELDKKTTHFFKEVFWKFVFLFLLLWVVMGNQNENVYIQNKDLKGMLTSNLEDVTDVQKTWHWLRNHLLPSLYLTQDYNYKPLNQYDFKFIQNAYAMRLGPPRLRQLRVKPDPCPIVHVVRRSLSRCANIYSTQTEDTSDYKSGWSQMLNDSQTNAAELQTLHQAFMYQSEAKMKGVPYWGLLETYNGGGYVANLGNTLTEAEQLVNELETNRWIDRYTRVVFVEFNVWNANSNLFNLAVLSFEYPTMGGVFNWLTIDSINLYRYAGSAGLFNLLIEIIATLFILLETVLESIKIKKQRRAYFKQRWNIVLWLCLLLYYCSMGVYAWRSVLTARTVEEMMNDRGKSVNFQKLAQAHNVFMCLMGIMGFLLELRLLHILRYARTVSIMTLTLKNCAYDLLNVAVGFAILFIAFTGISYIMFGAKMFEYRSVGATATFLTTAFLGLFNFQNTLEGTGSFGAFILLFYLIIMVMFWMNMFIAVLDQYLNAVKSDKTVISNDHEVIENLLKMLLGIVPGTKKETSSKEECNSLKKLETSEHGTTSEDITNWMDTNGEAAEDLAKSEASCIATEHSYNSKERLYQQHPRFIEDNSRKYGESLPVNFDNSLVQESSLQKSRNNHSCLEGSEDVADISLDLNNRISTVGHNDNEDQFITWNTITVIPYESSVEGRRLDSGISSEKTSRYCSSEDLTPYN